MFTEYLRHTLSFDLKIDNDSKTKTIKISYEKSSIQHKKSLKKSVLFGQHREHGVITSKIAAKSAGSHQFSIENIFRMDNPFVQERIFEDFTTRRYFSTIEVRSFQFAGQPLRRVSLTFNIFVDERRPLIEVSCDDS